VPVDALLWLEEVDLPAHAVGLNPRRLTGGFRSEGRDVADSPPDGTWLVLATVPRRRTARSRHLPSKS
jgi:hypothetical protein